MLRRKTLTSISDNRAFRKKLDLLIALSGLGVFPDLASGQRKTKFRLERIRNFFKQAKDEKAMATAAEKRESDMLKRERNVEAREIDVILHGSDGEQTIRGLEQRDEDLDNVKML